MKNEKFFCSVDSDSGLLIKEESEEVLLLSFIGSKGPLNLRLSMEESEEVARHIFSLSNARFVTPGSFVSEYEKYIDQSPTPRVDELTLPPTQDVHHLPDEEDVSQ